jgi:protein-tyrosine phosphatase
MATLRPAHDVLSRGGWCRQQPGSGERPPVDHDGEVEAPARLVPLKGSFNFRDLGGYPTGDGRTTRWSRLFRSDTLHELTPEDVVHLRSLGLATIVDLRTSRELAETGRGPLGPEPIAYHHLSVIRETRGEVVGEAVAAPAPIDDNLGERYLWYLEVGRSALVSALELLGDPANLPLVFHCAAGKDRTGVLAAVVLDILGVSGQVIVEDYVITQEHIERILDRYRDAPGFAERMARIPLSRFRVEAGTMIRFLDGLHQRFGGGRRWAEQAGVEPSLFGVMEELLLEEPG